MGCQLAPCGVEPAGLLGGVLRAATGEPAHQLIPRGREEKHQERVGHRGLHLAGTLDVDFEKHAAPGAQRLVHRASGRAVAERVVHGRPFEHLSVGDEAVELGVVDEEVVDAGDFSWSRLPGRRGYRQMNCGMVLPDEGRHRALAHCGGPRQNDETGGCGGSAILLALDQPLAEHRSLPRPETPDALRVGDPQLVHHPRYAGGTHAGHTAEQLSNPQGRVGEVLGFTPGRIDDVHGGCLARRDSGLHRRACPSCGDRCPRGGHAVDLRWFHRRPPDTDSWWRAIASARCAGPCERMLRDTATIVTSAAFP